MSISVSLNWTSFCRHLSGDDETFVPDCDVDVIEPVTCVIFNLFRTFSAPWAWVMYVGEGIGRDVNATLSADRRAASGRKTEEGTLKVPSSGPQSGLDYQAYLTPICAPMLLKP